VGCEGWADIGHRAHIGLFVESRATAATVAKGGPGTLVAGCAAPTEQQRTSLGVGTRMLEEVVVDRLERRTSLTSSPTAYSISRLGSYVVSIREETVTT